MDNYIQKIEFGKIAELRKEKFNPKNSENRKCIELEHINQVDGSINGFTNSKEQKSIKNVFYKGDVLFGKLRPYLRKYWLAEFDGVCSTEIWVLKPKKEICSSSQYLFNLVQSHEFIQATNVSSGSKMPRADWKYIVNYPLSIVNSFSEQKAIAKILSTWDKAIETLTELIEKKKIYKKGLMQKLLTPKKDWKEVRLGDICEYKNGGSFENYVNENGKYYLITLNSIDINGKLKSEHKKIDVTDNSLKKGDLIMVLSDIAQGNFLGLVEIIPDNNYVLNQRMGALKPKTEINTVFLRAYINKNQNYFKKMGQGSSQQNLSKGDILKFKIHLPNLQTQTKIANILSSADKEINILEQQLSKLKEQKKGLMQVLLTGKKRVKVIDNFIIDNG